jgi:hypothetical protein
MQTATADSDGSGRLARVTPALVLLVLAPIVAEFLLADFTIRQLPVLLALLPMYGGGALLVREVTRRTGRGWPTILLLGLAYALIEETFLTQSLFNPDYVHKRLLDYGYLPALGTSLNWSLFVLSIHVVWSVATPILIAEGLAGGRRATPWLKSVGLTVTAALYLAGSAMTAAFSWKASPFVASPTQFAVSAVLVLLAIVTAFAAFGRTHAAPAWSATASAPSLAIVGVSTLVLASAYLASEGYARSHGIGPALPLLFRLACEVMALALLARWARDGGWTHRHYLAVAAGTTLTYFLFGLNVLIGGHTNIGAPTNAVDVAGHVGLGVATLALIAWAVRRGDAADRRRISP